jgi:type II secretory ATPase GspE/PulE/Tfp pilus assembly ATPase PilB-like protein
VEDAGLMDPYPKMCIPVGCSACDKTGYRGRIGVYEMLVFDEAISESIRSGASPLELRKVAQANGLRTLAEDALLKVELDLTSFGGGHASRPVQEGRFWRNRT